MTSGTTAGHRSTVDELDSGLFVGWSFVALGLLLDSLQESSSRQVVFSSHDSTLLATRSATVFSAEIGCH